MNTQLQLCSFGQAKRLKKLGFNWPSETFYVDGSLDDCHNLINYNTNEGTDEDGEPQEDDGYCSAPTIQHALMWFREVRGVITCFSYSLTYGYVGEHNGFRGLWNYTDSFKTFKEVEYALLDELLKLKLD